MDKLKTVSGECLKLSKVHGIVHIAINKHLPVRILWSICVLVSAGACSYLMIQNILSYLDYEVITKLSVMKDSSSTFPTISICNSVAFVTRNSSNFIKNIMNQPFFDQYENISINDQPIEPFKLLYQYFSAINAKNLPIEVEKSFGLKMDQMFLSCLYRGVKCLPSDFEWYYDLLYGNCYRFNTGLNKTLKIATTVGKWNGLRLELFLGSTNDVEISQQSTGVHIFIHNDSVRPSSYEGFDAQTAKETNIAVTRTIVNRLSNPYSDCVNKFSSYVYSTLVELFGRYRYSDCLKYCFQKRLIEKCECQDPSCPILNSTIRICSKVSDLFVCSYPIYNSFYNEDLTQTCPYCKYECEKMMYEYSSSHNAYPTQKYANFLLKLNQIKANNITTYEKLKRNVLALNIFYDDLQYKVIKEMPIIDLLTLISNIGGILGLFLGMSFINIMEIVEFLCEVLFIFSHKLKNTCVVYKVKQENQLDTKHGKHVLDAAPFKSIN